MPFDGSGNFTPSPAPNFPAVSGNTISSTYYNVVINDIASGLSNALTRDGQGKPSANINWNAKNLTNVATFEAVTASFTSALGVASGGTGLVAVPTNGQLLIGDGVDYALGTLTAGAGISVTNGAGTITVASTLTGMTYPGAGVAVSTGAAWDTSKTAPTGVIVGDTDAQTLTNKSLTSPALTGVPTAPTAANTTSTTQLATTAFVQQEKASVIQAVASAATVTPTFLNDQVNITALAVACQLLNPTGTAVEKGIVVRIKDNGTARALTYDTQYRAIGVTLPSTTVLGKTLYLGMIYNSTDTKWDVVAVAQEA